MHISNPDLIRSTKDESKQLKLLKMRQRSNPSPLPWGLNGIFVQCYFGKVAWGTLVITLTWFLGKYSLFYLLVTYWKQQQQHQTVAVQQIQRKFSRNWPVEITVFFDVRKVSSYKFFSPIDSSTILQFFCKQPTYQRTNYLGSCKIRF